MQPTLRSRLDAFLIWVTHWRTLSIGIPTAIVFVVAMLIFSSAHDVEHERIRLAFESQASNFSSALGANFNLYQNIVQSMASFFAVSNHVDRYEFNVYVQKDLAQYAGIQALEWVPRVPQEARPDYEQAAHDDGLTDFQLMQWSPDGNWITSAAHWADEYFPVYYMQPHKGNENALGIDLASNPTRRAALEQARDTGQPVATARITLAQEAGTQAGVLIIAPIFAQDQTIGAIDSIEKRREYLRGYALGVFRVGDIVTASLKNYSYKDIIVRITDESAEADQRLLFISDGMAGHKAAPGHASRHTNNLQYTNDIQIGGRQWRFSFTTTTAFVSALHGREAGLIGISGIFITVLVAVVLFLMTERTRRIEQQVARRTAELARANEALVQSNIELQQFAYVASHDLQAPLRGIAGFAQVLQLENKGKLSADAEHYVERIVDGAKRMQTLIKDLLTYSRIDSRLRPFRETSLNEVFDDAVTQLSVSIEEAAAKVTRDDLPTVVGDPSLLSQILHNLIGNGIKYNTHQAPHVHVAAEKQGHEWIVSVRDNGIGIDAKYHERIFEIFRRLHTQQQYPGTGIGLAICQRIAQRHGGRIWVESESGNGTTIYFSISDRSTSEHE